MENDKAVKEILEIVTFLRDAAASKEDVEKIVSEAKSELLTHIDGLVVQHKKNEIESVATRALYKQLVTYIAGLAKFTRYPTPIS